jgi:ParB family transcriptional regulator, chromosome partitioning protein
MSRKNIFSADPSPLLQSAVPSEHTKVRPLLGLARPQRHASALGAISQSLDSINARAKRADEIEELLALGRVIVELDPDLIDPSPIADRLPDDTDAAFQSFKDGIERDGQKLPIQVRPHPLETGRFQIVYGRRRCRAAKSLGRPVKAVVANLSDAELVVAQGIENSARQDLTWIERAVFAWRMDEIGLKAKEIRAALAIDDSQLANMRAVIRVLSPDLATTIGRAPTIGRRRWMELANAISSDPAALQRIETTLSADKVLRPPAPSPAPEILSADKVVAISSDERFIRALAAANAPKGNASTPLSLFAPSGKSIGSVAFGPSGVKFVIDKKYAPAFEGFLKDEVAVLMQKFFTHQGEE